MLFRSIGFAADGNGETNNPVEITVAVTSGAEDNDCVQADINMVDITKIIITSRPRFLLLIVSPRKQIH